MGIVDLQAWNRPIIEYRSQVISTLKPYPLVIFLQELFNVVTPVSTMHAFNSLSLFCVLVKPAVIGVPRVRVLNELYDTPNRQFPVGTMITVTCQGEVGSDANKVCMNPVTYINIK